MRKNYYGQRFGKLLVVDKRDVILTDKVLCKCDCGNDYFAQVNGMVQGRLKSCGCWYKKCRFGERYGFITIIDKRELFTKEDALCRCDCGNEKYILINRLKTGNTKSCGCIRDKKNYCDAKFGKLTVVDNRFVRVQDKVLCRCDCGVSLLVTVNNLKRGHTTSCGCKERKIRIDITGETFGYLFVTGIASYRNGRKILWNCKCTNCGQDAVVSQSHLKSGHTISCGCLKSLGEKKIAEILSENGIKFIRQKKYDGCVYKKRLRFDFFLPNINVLIEYDGIQHFESVKQFGGDIAFEEEKIKDGIKNKYCKDNNINLIRIKYTDFNNINQILIDNKIIILN